MLILKQLMAGISSSQVARKGETSEVNKSEMRAVNCDGKKTMLTYSVYVHLRGMSARCIFS